MIKILFVCTGNTCRSPMAEGIFRQKVEQGSLQAEVKSAGVAAFPGAPASNHTDAILKKRGIHHAHASQPVTQDLVGWADLILTMTESHKQMLCRQFPEAQPKVYTLKEYAGEQDPDIPDPFGGSLETYEETERELERVLHKLKEKISGA